MQVLEADSDGRASSSTAAGCHRPDGRRRQQGLSLPKMLHLPKVYIYVVYVVQIKVLNYYFGVIFFFLENGVHISQPTPRFYYVF